jgi:hypothetical protein
MAGFLGREKRIILRFEELWRGVERLLALFIWLGEAGRRGTREKSSGGDGGGPSLLQFLFDMAGGEEVRRNGRFHYEKRRGESAGLLCYER